MNRKNEKGFTLVLSLVLLMAMSLMGGALIVISASDHQSNNVSDEYQQTFYVAETALYEGEKYLLNQFLGPYNSSGKRDVSKRSLLSNSTTNFNPAGTPNLNPCYNSFQDIDRATYKNVKGPPPNNPLSTSFIDVKFQQNYYDFLGSNVIQAGKNNKERDRMKKFYYQYFLTQVGSAPFKGTGTSVKKQAGNTGSDGVAYRVYGCGIKKEKDDINLVVALESVIVLPK